VRCSGAGGSGGSAPASGRSLAASVRGIPSLAASGEEPAETPRLQPARPVPGSRGAENRTRRTRLGGSKNWLGVSAVRKPQWKAIAPRLAELLGCVRGAVGAWARGQNRLGRGGFPAWQPGEPSRPNGGPSGRGRASGEREMLTAQRVCCGVCLVAGFAFQTRLARHT